MLQVSVNSSVTLVVKQGLFVSGDHTIIDGSEQDPDNRPVSASWNQDEYRVSLSSVTEKPRGSS